MSKKDAARQERINQQGRMIGVLRNENEVFLVTSDEQARRIVTLTEERAVLQHQLSLIDVSTAAFATDCSTPTFQKVRNAIARIEKLEADLVCVTTERDEALDDVSTLKGNLGPDALRSRVVDVEMIEKRTREELDYIQHGLGLLSQALDHRTTEHIRKRYGGFTPECINGETDMLTVLFDDFARVTRERDEARRAVVTMRRAGLDESDICSFCNEHERGCVPDQCFAAHAATLIGEVEASGG